MAQTKTEAQLMEATAGKFETVNDSLQGMLRRLMNELEVLQTAWKGAGGRSFENVKIAWAQNQSTLQNALAETATAIRTAGQQYTTTDQESSGRVGAIDTSGPNLPL